MKVQSIETDALPSADVNITSPPHLSNSSNTREPALALQKQRINTTIKVGKAIHTVNDDLIENSEKDKNMQSLSSPICNSLIDVHDPYQRTDQELVGQLNMIRRTCSSQSACGSNEIKAMHLIPNAVQPDNMKETTKKQSSEAYFIQPASCNEYSNVTICHACKNNDTCNCCFIGFRKLRYTIYI